MKVHKGNDKFQTDENNRLSFFSMWKLTENSTEKEMKHICLKNESLAPPSIIYIEGF